MAGRPKTLDANHALATALEGYWRDGVYGMSVNEVCRRAGISKPGLYREFGGEDKLLTAVLRHYEDTVIARVRQHLDLELTFYESMALFIQAFFANADQPQGCLLAELRLAHSDLGEMTQATVVEVVRGYRAMFRAWLERRQSLGEVSAEIELDQATRYLDSQLMLAAAQAQRGDDPKDISERFMMSLQALTAPTRI